MHNQSVLSYVIPAVVLHYRGSRNEERQRESSGLTTLDSRQRGNAELQRE
jgi:hypothetical protein